MKKTWKKGDKFNATPYGAEPTVIIAIKESFFKGYDFVDVDGIHWNLSEVIPYKEDSKVIKTTKKQREKLNKVIKIVENKRTFKTGAVRDNEEGKEDYIESISWLTLKRYALYMKKQESKYGRGNWKKGIDVDSYERSLMRHLQKYLSAKYHNIDVEPDVDHLSAALFNLQGLIHEEEKLKSKQ